MKSSTFISIIYHFTLFTISTKSIITFIYLTIYNIHIELELTDNML